MASQARQTADRSAADRSGVQGQPARSAGTAFRPLALPALAAAMQAVRGGRPDRASPRSGR